MPMPKECKKHFPTPWAFGVFMSSLLLLVGCGRGNRDRQLDLQAVSGRVWMHGAPLPGGTITFVPLLAEEAGGRPGIARIESDGSYSVGNANPNKPQGLKPGKYRVTVLHMRIAPVAGGRPHVTPLVPSDFSDWRTTPLAFECVQATDHADFNIVPNG